MALTFPADKSDFTAPNGITYSWDAANSKWRVRAYRVDANGEFVAKPYTVYVGDNPPTESVAPDKAFQEGELWYSTITLELFAYGAGAWWPTAADFSGDIALINSALEQAEQDIDTNEQDIEDLQIKVTELETTKGKVARYKVDNTIGTPVSRPGELSVNIPYWPNTTIISFGIEDLDNILTKPMSDGDIAEFIDVGTNKVTRYKITDASGAPTLVGVEYISGDADWAVNQEKQVYIYPQNQAGATKDYVDAQDALRVLKTGDTFTNYLDFEAHGGGARFFRGADKYFSVWSFQVNETRCRIDPGRDFKLTGYPDGDSTERHLLWWDQANDAFHVSRLADPLYDDSAISRSYANSNYLQLSGGTTTGKVTIGKPGSNGAGFAIEGTTRSGDEGEILHVFHNAGSYNDAVNYEGRVDSDNNIQTKKSVQELIADAIGAGTGAPVGTVAMWLSNTAPDGWFFLKGGAFSVGENPQLHAVLQGTHGYTEGFLPDLRGLYPGGAGAGPANLTPEVAGHVHAYKTGQPSGGPPETSYTIPNGGTRKFNGSGGTNAYSDGLGKVFIDDGWDAVTRPPTFALHFIIRGDY